MRKGLIINTIILISFLILTSCSEEDDFDMEQFKKETEQRNQDKSIEPSDMSIFNLESDWENQDADKVKLSFLNDKPTVMTMIYTHCEYSCPVIVEEMKDIYGRLGDEYTSEVNFLFVSIDPIHDRPETLARFMKTEELNPDHWTMLTGTESNIRELAAVLGFKYKKSSLMDYAHSNLITLLNKNGEIVQQLEGFEEEKDKFIKETIELIKEN